MLQRPVSRRRFLQHSGTCVLVAGLAPYAAAATVAANLMDAQLCVYGGTPAGVMAAVQFRRMGGSAVLVEPGQHLGGMAAGGLGHTDIGTPGAVGGLAAEFYRRVYAAYNGTSLTPTSPARYIFEPHVAEQIFNTLVAEAGVPVVFGARLAGVAKRDGRLTELTTTNGHTVRAQLFVDASYEGDLLAAAGVAFTVGREGNARYGEQRNGVQLSTNHHFTVAVDPYRTPGVPSSGLVPGVSAAPLAPVGSADSHVQAYCFRLCLTAASDGVPIGRPAGYDPARYELVRRTIAAGYTGPFFTADNVGGGKVDANNRGAVSFDHIGAADNYATASWSARDAIVAEHRAYQQGLLYFLANDPAVPPAIRSSVAQWRLPRDEFADSGGWPHQLYVREARRMVAAYVMTEHNCRGTATVSDGIGLASYGMDSHNCQRLVVGGVARNEGNVEISVPQPYPVAYRAIVPLEGQCSNLLVPVCLSASHIAYGSIRMEPVFMVLGQAAGTAAKLALEAGAAVQRVSIAALQARLREHGQVLTWPPGGEVIVDNAGSGVTRAGTWVRSTGAGGYYGADYEHDNNANKGVNRLRWTPSLPAAGPYTVALRWTAHENRATNVPIDIVHSGGTTTRTVNQRVSGGQWVALGTFPFAAGTAGSVLVRTTGTDGYVVADAVRWTPA